MHDVEPGQEKTNAERITEEYADLVAVFGMLRDDDAMIHGIDGEALKSKRIKVRTFLEYSRSQGTLQ